MAEEKKPFQAFDHGMNPIDLRHLSPNPMIMRPTEIHHKADGDIDNNPSFCIVNTSPIARYAIVSEISLKMLNEGLNELGYEIVKKEKP